MKNIRCCLGAHNFLETGRAFERSEAWHKTLPDTLGRDFKVPNSDFKKDFYIVTYKCERCEKESAIRVKKVKNSFCKCDGLHPEHAKELIKKLNA